MRSTISRRGFILAAPAIVACTALGARALANDSWTGDIQKGEVIVRLKPGVSILDIVPILKRHGAMPGRSFAPAAPRDFHVYCRPDDEADLATELMASGMVEFANPVPVPKTSVLPNDPAANDPDPDENFIRAINADKVWDRFKLANFPSGVPYVIDVDTGMTGSFSGGVFTPTLADMNGTVLDQFYDVATGTQDVRDGTGHGTGVMSIMCAITNNGSNIPGIGWGGKGKVVKAVTFADQITAFNWIISNVTPPSFVTFPWIFNSVPGQTFYDAVAALYNAGHLLFGASGDDFTAPCDYGTADVPAPYCVTVTACGVGSRSSFTYKRASYANYGPAKGNVSGQGMTACAPGGANTDTPSDTIGILSTGGSYTYSSEGTSYAVPVLAGIARFLSTIRPDLTIPHIRSLVCDQSLTIPCTGFSPYSMGCVDFLTLVEHVQSLGPISFR